LIRSTPIVLIWIRLVITVVLFFDALDGEISEWFITALSFAVFLDLVDGMLARRLGVATQRLREADSTLDFVMMVVFAICCWLTRRAVIAPFANLIVVLVAVNVLSFIPAIIKFGFLPPYHTLSARIAGGLMFLAAVELFSADRAGAMMNVAIIAGFLSHLDRVVITLILPSRPDTDVNGIWHAAKIRDQYVIPKNATVNHANDKTFNAQSGV